MKKRMGSWWEKIRAEPWKAALQRDNELDDEQMDKSEDRWAVILVVVLICCTVVPMVFVAWMLLTVAGLFLVTP